MKLTQRALQLRLKRLGDDHPLTASSKLNLSRALLKLANPDHHERAAALAREALKVFEREFAPTDRRRRDAINALIALYAPASLNDAAQQAQFKQALLRLDQTTQPASSP